MGAGAVVVWRDWDGGVDGEVMEETEDGLRFWTGNVMGFDEVII